MEAAAAAAPKLLPMPCRERARQRTFCTPRAWVIRQPMSYPATTPLRNRSPSAPSLSATASAAGTIAQPGCMPALSWESSVSSEWAIIAIAKAAWIAVVTTGDPATCASGAPPCCAANCFGEPARLEAGAADDRPQRIENVMFGFLDHRGGKFCLPALGNIGAEPADDIPGYLFYLRHFHPLTLSPFLGQGIIRKLCYAL